MLQLDWEICDTDDWCPLYAVDLTNPYFDNLGGVYIIFYLGSGKRKGKVVRVGQGVIMDRIAAHREEWQIKAHRQRDLLITWAPVPYLQRDGVERYLASKWHPLVDARVPNVTSILVNSAFEE